MIACTTGPSACSSIHSNAGPVTQHCHRPCQQEQLILIDTVLHPSRPTEIGLGGKHTVWHQPLQTEIGNFECKLGCRTRLNERSGLSALHESLTTQVGDAVCNPGSGSIPKRCACAVKAACMYCHGACQLVLHCNAAQPQGHVRQQCVARHNSYGRRCYNARQQRRVRQAYCWQHTHAEQ